MTLRWILGISQIFACLYCLNSSKLLAAQLDAYLVVRLEGRSLEEPNLEALDSLRKKFPELVAIHLINPSYFKDNPQSASNLEAIQKRIGTKDEVGLYLALSQSLVKAANLIPIHKPTFWGYGDEICTSDCGLQVPATVYNRADIAQLFWVAHESLKAAGFTQTTSFAVNGWLSPAGIAEIAEDFGYKNDLTGIDPKLVQAQLKEYPVADWIKDVPGPVSTAGLSAWIQAGGIIEFNNDEAVLKQFDQFLSKDHDRMQIFSISVSEENLFMSRVRLVKSIEGMKRKAEAGGDELVFATMNGGKNGRPIAKNVVIRKRL